MSDVADVGILVQIIPLMMFLHEEAAITSNADQPPQKRAKTMTPTPSMTMHKSKCKRPGRRAANCVVKQQENHPLPQCIKGSMTPSFLTSEFMFTIPHLKLGDPSLAPWSKLGIGK